MPHLSNTNVKALERPEAAPIGFTIDLVEKDLELIFGLATRVGAPMDQARIGLDLEFGQHSTGYTGDTVVDERSGAVQMGFRMSQLEGGGRVDAHLHSFEETVYIIDGELVADLPGGSHRLVAGDTDFFLSPCHMLSANESSSRASFVDSRSAHNSPR